MSIGFLGFDMSDITRIQNQDSWKRTQIRIPQDDYDAVADYAKENNLSLNTAMLELISKGLQSKSGIHINVECMDEIANKVVERLKDQ